MIELSYYPTKHKNIEAIKSLGGTKNKGSHSNKAIHTSLTPQELIQNIQNGEIRKISSGIYKDELGYEFQVGTAKYPSPNGVTRSKPFMKRSRKAEALTQLVLIDIDYEHEDFNTLEKLIPLMQKVVGKKFFWFITKSQSYYVKGKTFKFHVWVVMDKLTSIKSTHEGALRRFGKVGLGYHQRLSTHSAEGRIKRPELIVEHEVIDASWFKSDVAFAVELLDKTVDPVAYVNEGKLISEVSWNLRTLTLPEKPDPVESSEYQKALVEWEEYQESLPDGSRLKQAAPQNDTLSGVPYPKDFEIVFEGEKPVVKGRTISTLGDCVEVSREFGVKEIPLDSPVSNQLADAAKFYWNDGSPVYTIYEGQAGSHWHPIDMTDQAVLEYYGQYAPIEAYLEKSFTPDLWMKSPTGSGKTVSLLKYAHSKIVSGMFTAAMFSVPQNGMLDSVLHECESLGIPAEVFRKGDGKQFESDACVGKVIIMTLAKSSAHVSGFVPAYKNWLHIHDEFDDYFSQETEFTESYWDMTFGEKKAYKQRIYTSATLEFGMIPYEKPDCIEFKQDRLEKVEMPFVIPLADILDMPSAFIALNETLPAHQLAKFLKKCGRSVRLFFGKNEVDPETQEDITKLDLKTESDFIVTTQVITAGVSIKPYYKNIIVYQNVINYFGVRSILQVLARPRQRKDVNMYIVPGRLFFLDDEHRPPILEFHKKASELAMTIADYKIYAAMALAPREIAKRKLEGKVIHFNYIGSMVDYYERRRRVEKHNWEIFRGGMLDGGYEVSHPGPAPEYEDIQFDYLAGLTDDERYEYEIIQDKTQMLKEERKGFQTHKEYNKFLDRLKTFPKGSIESAIYKKSHKAPKIQGAHANNLLVNLTEATQVRSRWDSNLRQTINHSIVLFHSGVIKLTQEYFQVGVKVTRKHILESLNAIQRRRIPAAPRIYMEEDWVLELRKFALWDFYDEHGDLMAKASRGKIRFAALRTLNVVPDDWISEGPRPLMGMEKQIA